MMNESPPPVDPAICTDEDLRDIIASDPFAHPGYQRELDRRQALQAEIDRWRDRIHDED